MTKGKNVSTDEQGYLIDVQPKNKKEIVTKAKAYKRAVIARLSAGDKESNLKSELLELIKGANLQPTEDGRIKFSLNGFKITVTPRDMLIQVKSDADEDE